MALKPDRICIDYALDYFLGEVAERGVVLSLKTGGSGVSNDNVNHQATVAAAPSGSVALGFLLNDVVDVDRSRFFINPHKDEVPVRGKVTILRKGQVTTNKIVPGVSPAAGATAYLGVSGLITSNQASGAPVVGRFETSKDEDGFAKVSINLP